MSSLSAFPVPGWRRPPCPCPCPAHEPPFLPSPMETAGARAPHCRCSPLNAAAGCPDLLLSLQAMALSDKPARCYRAESNTAGILAARPCHPFQGHGAGITP
jgi:hypothetical protein